MLIVLSVRTRVFISIHTDAHVAPFQNPKPLLSSAISSRTILIFSDCSNMYFVTGSLSLTVVSYKAGNDIHMVIGTLDASCVQIIRLFVV
ncbi:hypothetical protein QVD17_16816 [Tagetes erecta]|uniref:Uncharacterized protein n=1 Tax=Tagetes erecta TaxID=13708 RepID=A0AAD8KSR1_TARER|nr:hypothetical protein QVD17_16816 [Tagetes erecta]